MANSNAKIMLIDHLIMFRLRLGSVEHSNIRAADC